MGSGFPEQTVVKSRKLGLLQGKSSEVERERMESLERNERVCGECPTLMLILIDGLQNCLYFCVNNDASLSLLVGNEGIDVKINYFRMVCQ
jgi:hypothetical protein